MKISEIIKNIIDTLGGYTFMHELKPVANDKLDHVRGNAAVLYCISDWVVDTSAGNYREYANVNLLLLSRVQQIGPNGCNIAPVVDDRKTDAVKVISALTASCSVDDEITIRSVFDDFDGGFCGVSVQMRVKTKQPTCISSL